MLMSAFSTFCICFNAWWFSSSVLEAVQSDGQRDAQESFSIRKLKVVDDVD